MIKAHFYEIKDLIMTKYGIQVSDIFDWTIFTHISQENLLD